VTAAAAPTYPNLVADPAENPRYENFVVGGTERLLLRFDGFIHNAGSGALEIRGSSPSGAPATAFQRIFDSNGRFFDQARPSQLVYETNDTHNHWHFKAAARYSLWNEAKTAEVAPSTKAGFCLEDTQKVSGTDAGAYFDGDIEFCRQGSPVHNNILMGVSPGWRDVYHEGLAFQWVDISNTPPGRYYLRTEVDPENTINEGGGADEANSATFAPFISTISGHVAKPVTPPTIQPGQQASITLAAETFSAPPNIDETAGPLRFVLESAPAHGSVNVAVGQVFEGPNVIYTPAAGYQGPDSFAYSALDAWNPGYPTSRPTASASLQVGTTPVSAPAVSVAIAGAPARLTVGSSAQLSAQVSNGPADVVWSVNGVPGGATATGTITASGLYRAPASPPPGGRVTIRAAAKNTPTAFAEASIQIVASTTQIPSPTPGAPKVGVNSKKRAILARPRLVRDGQYLVAQTVSLRTGVARLRVVHRGRTLGTCVARVKAGRAFACRTTLRGKALGIVKVSAQLRVGKRTVATARASYRLKGFKVSLMK
jgi:Lysyl oxidase/Bacterial Ig domain